MDFKDIVQRRRSFRSFTDEPVSDGDVKMILRAGLMSPSGHSKRGWHFFKISDKKIISQLSAAKSLGADALKTAPLAIVVAYDRDVSDVWVEDASIAAVTMQYQATELGLGSCWIQMRLRGREDGTSAEASLRSILAYPESWNTLCILAVGHPAVERKMQDETKLKWDAVSEKA